MPGPNLEDLQRIFREEFDDLVRLLTELAGRVAASTNEARQAEHAGELRRILHTLKGASRAAGYAEIEAAAHRLEERIADWAKTPPDRDAIASAIDLTLKSLASVAPVPAPQEAPADDGPGPESEHGLARETLRVDAASLNDVLSATEDLVLEMARGTSRDGARTLDGLAGDLLRDLEHARRAVGSNEALTRTATGVELLRRLDGAVSTARTVVATSEAARDREQAAWKGASARAASLAAAARAIRQERFDLLVIPATQAAREAADAVGVEVRVHAPETGVRFDRRLRDELREIMLHLVRNAVAHGIEPASERRAKGKAPEGTIEIHAEEGDGELRIEVKDDGRGIDTEAVRARARALGLVGEPLEAIFAAGLSTVAEASALAGRGVGLDIVRDRVATLHGRISVSTVAGAGTTFRLSLPPDLSLTRALLVRAGDYVAAVRLSAVERILRLPRSAVEDVGGRAHVLEGGVLVPLASLAGELSAQPTPLPPGEKITAVLTGSADRRVALAVDELLDEREIAVRPTRGRFRSVRFASGTTVSEGGTAVWVLDVRALAQHARATYEQVAAVATAPRRVLVVDDSATTRELERSLLRSAGFEVEAVANGELAWMALQGDRPFDVVVSDIEMPVLDGFGLLARLRASPRTAALPVVLVTALEDPADKQRALDMGASAYIVKSAFDEELLLDAISHLI